MSPGEGLHGHSNGMRVEARTAFSNDVLKAASLTIAAGSGEQEAFRVQLTVL
jgi:hypothetical protein